MTGGRIMRRAWAITLLTVLAPPGLREIRAQAGLLVPTSTGRPDPAVISLREMAIDVGIARGYARVNVRQVYENHGSRPIHARYIFPASTRAAVYAMTMTVGNVRTVATIKEREQATRQFEAARREGKNASLLEQSRPNVFSMKLANVMPGDTVVV